MSDSQNNNTAYELVEAYGQLGLGFQLTYATLLGHSQSLSVVFDQMENDLIEYESNSMMEHQHSSLISACAAAAFHLRQHHKTTGQPHTPETIMFLNRVFRYVRAAANYFHMHENENFDKTAQAAQQLMEALMPDWHKISNRAGNQVLCMVRLQSDLRASSSNTDLERNILRRIGNIMESQPRDLSKENLDALAKDLKAAQGDQSSCSVNFKILCGFTAESVAIIANIHGPLDKPLPLLATRESDPVHWFARQQPAAARKILPQASTHTRASA